MAHSSDDPWLLVPRPLRQLPADLAAVVGWVLVTNLSVFLPVVRETPLRIALGLPFVLFVPGYALIAALFPEAGESPVAAEDGGADGDAADDGGADGDAADDGLLRRAANREGIDGIERVALAFGLSIAVVPLTGLALNFTPWGIRLAPIMVSLSALTLGLVWLGAVRRWELPVDERFRVPYRAWAAAGRAELLEPETRADAALNVMLVASILLATGSVGYAVAFPKPGERFTEFYLLTEDDDGDLVADGYPTEFVRGEGQSVVVGIGNQEHEAVRYTVVVELQRVRLVDNGTNVTVLEERELRRTSVRLGHNETWHREQVVTPTMTGERLRLQYLLYRGDAPADARAETAYRELHLWVNVSAPNETSG